MALEKSKEEDDDGDGTEVSRHASQGNLLRRRGQFVEAAKCFSAALRIRPRDVTLLLVRGRCHLSAGNTDAAAKDGRAAAALEEMVFQEEMASLEQALEAGRMQQALQLATAAAANSGPMAARNSAAPRRDGASPTEAHHTRSHAAARSATPSSGRHPPRPQRSCLGLLLEGEAYFAQGHFERAADVFHLGLRLLRDGGAAGIDVEGLVTAQRGAPSSLAFAVAAPLRGVGAGVRPTSPPSGSSTEAASLATSAAVSRQPQLFLAAVARCEEALMESVASNRYGGYHSASTGAATERCVERPRSGATTGADAAEVAVATVVRTPHPPPSSSPTSRRTLAGGATPSPPPPPTATRLTNSRHSATPLAHRLSTAATDPRTRRLVHALPEFRRDVLFMSALQGDVRLTSNEGNLNNVPYEALCYSNRNHPANDNIRRPRGARSSVPADELQPQKKAASSRRMPATSNPQMHRRYRRGGSARRRRGTATGGDAAEQQLRNILAKGGASGPYDGRGLANGGSPAGSGGHASGEVDDDGEPHDGRSHLRSVARGFAAAQSDARGATKEAPPPPDTRRQQTEGPNVRRGRPFPGSGVVVSAARSAAAQPTVSPFPAASRGASPASKVTPSASAAHLSAASRRPMVHPALADIGEEHCVKINRHRNDALRRCINRAVAFFEARYEFWKHQDHNTAFPTMAELQPHPSHRHSVTGEGRNQDERSRSAERRGIHPRIHHRHASATTGAPCTLPLRVRSATPLAAQRDLLKLVQSSTVAAHVRPVAAESPAVEGEGAASAGGATTPSCQPRTSGSAESKREKMGVATSSARGNGAAGAGSSLPLARPPEFSNKKLLNRQLMGNYSGSRASASTPQRPLSARATTADKIHRAHDGQERGGDAEDEQHRMAEALLDPMGGNADAAQMRTVWSRVESGSRKVAALSNEARASMASSPVMRDLQGALRERLTAAMPYELAMERRRHVQEVAEGASFAVRSLGGVSTSGATQLGTSLSDATILVSADGKILSASSASAALQRFGAGGNNVSWSEEAERRDRPWRRPARRQQAAAGMNSSDQAPAGVAHFVTADARLDDAMETDSTSTHNRTGGVAPAKSVTPAKGLPASSQVGGGATAPFRSSSLSAQSAGGSPVAVRVHERRIRAAIFDATKEAASGNFPRAILLVASLLREVDSLARISEAEGADAHTTLEANLRFLLGQIYSRLGEDGLACAEFSAAMISAKQCIAGAEQRLRHCRAASEASTRPPPRRAFVESAEDDVAGATETELRKQLADYSRLYDQCVSALSALYATGEASQILVARGNPLTAKRSSSSGPKRRGGTAADGRDSDGGDGGDTEDGDYLGGDGTGEDDNDDNDAPFGGDRTEDDDDDDAADRHGEEEATHSDEASDVFSDVEDD